MAKEFDKEKHANFLESAKKTQFRGERAVEAAKKSAQAREKRKAIRTATQELLGCIPAMSQEQLGALKKMGIENKQPNVQTIILAQVAALALKGDLGAVQLLASFAGEDAATLANKERMRVEREKIKALKDTGVTAALPVIVRNADGSIEVRDE